MNPAAEARAKVKANHPEAVVVERGRNSLKHRLADHEDGRQRFALDVAIGPLHYGPDNDQEIDTALVPSTAPWDWEMTKAGFEVRALSNLSAGQVIEYRSGSEWVRFQPMALQYSNDLNQIQQISMPQSVMVIVDDDTLTWADGYGPGRSLSWQAQTARLAKLLTIDSLAELPAVDQFILDGGNPVLELNLIFAHSSGVTPYVNGQEWKRGDRDTQGLVEFRDAQGNVLWWFNLPRSWDSEGNEQLGTFRFKKQGNSLYVTHRVPLSFVQGAVYPLMVDVTVDEQVGASDDDAHEADDNTGFSVISTQAKMDSNTAAGSRFNLGNRFQTVAVPQGDTIDVANIQVNVFATTMDDPNVDILAEDVDDAVDFAATADVTDRVRTTASVAWVATGIGDGFKTSPDFNSVVQEVVDRASWASGNDMVIFLDGKADANFFFRERSYDDDPANAAKLHIEYTAAGGETRSLAGSQPASTGTLARIEKALRALAGSQPLATGTLTRIFGRPRSLAGNQPSATGTLVAVLITSRSLAGAQPSATGTLTRIEKAIRALSGAQPAAVGTIVRIEKAVRTLAGSQPAGTGTLSRIEKALRALAGDQPAGTGTLVRIEKALRALAGNQPAATGALARVKSGATFSAMRIDTGTVSLLEKDDASVAIGESDDAVSIRKSDDATV